MEALKADYRTAPMSAQDRVMLEFVEQITRDATRITPEFHDRLRAAGFDDRGILQITLIASWFNYINRVADALGVGRGASHRHRASCGASPSGPIRLCLVLERITWQTFLRPPPHLIAATVARLLASDRTVGDQPGRRRDTNSPPAGA